MFLMVLETLGDIPITSLPLTSANIYFYTQLDSITKILRELINAN
jgi:hypothetical protein